MIKSSNFNLGENKRLIEVTLNSFLTLKFEKRE